MLLTFNKDIRKGKRQFFQYPSNGQKTRSNGKKAFINNLKLINLYCYIFKKFYNYSYHINSKIFFRAYIINKLFLFNWTAEWAESRGMAFVKKKKKTKKVYFNLENTSKFIITGYKRTGTAGKRGKARTKITSISIGMPLDMISKFVFKKKKNSITYENTTK